MTLNTTSARLFGGTASTTAAMYVPMLRRTFVCGF